MWAWRRFHLACCRSGSVTAPAARLLAQIAAAVVGSGGTVVIPENAALLRSDDFFEVLGWTGLPKPSLEYGQAIDQSGLHIMATPTDHGVETLTGLGGTGVQLILAHVDGPPLQGHPMIPVLQIATDGPAARRFLKDLDLVIDPANDAGDRLCRELLSLLCDAASHDYEPRLWAAGCVDFQLTRGLLGVSL